MKTHVLRGSKHEIAAALSRISGEVHEAIVFEEESSPTAGEAGPDEVEDIFAEMAPYMVEGNTDVDDSREAIYTRLEGE
jgi:hypothetical protein